MQEWLNWHAWKVCRLLTGSPGFESPSFRHICMTIRILTIGKNHDSWIKEGIEVFLKRLRPPFTAEYVILPHSNKPTPPLAVNEESKRIIERLAHDDFMILLDETGKNISSPEFSQLIESNSHRPIVIIIGGAYGVTKTVRDRADVVWSLSRLVFPHQLVRLILAEQLYRAQEIAKNGKYHHGSISQ